MKKKKTKAGEKMYHVHFPHANYGASDHFFGSLSAIYTVFTPEQIGCKVETLWHHKIGENKPYVGKKCTVSMHTIVRKKTNRGKK